MIQSSQPVWSHHEEPNLYESSLAGGALPAGALPQTPLGAPALGMWQREHQRGSGGGSPSYILAAKPPRGLKSDCHQEVLLLLQPQFFSMEKLKKYCKVTCISTSIMRLYKNLANIVGAYTVESGR